MELVPLNPPAVLTLDYDLNQWLERLRALDTISSTASNLPLLAKSDYEGKLRCAICMDPKPVVSSDSINAIFQDCGHGCCHKCFLRWYILPGESNSRCSLCLANEVYSKVKIVPVAHFFPMISRGDDDRPGPFAQYLPSTVPNNRVIFTRLESPAEVLKSVSGEQSSLMPFFNWGDLRFLCNPNEENVSDFVLNLLMLKCGNCPSTRPLFEVFNYMIEGKFDFDSFTDHLKGHNQLLCKLCLLKGNKFPSEFDLFGSSSSLDKHLKDVHPHTCTICPFTRHFDSKENLVEHCRGFHHFCHTCDSDVLFFSSTALLFEHIRSRHFACEVCPKGTRHMIAFKTVVEWRNHHEQVHPTVDIEEHMTTLYYTGSNSEEIEDDTRRNKLDEIDGKFRRMYASGKLNFALPPLV